MLKLAITVMVAGSLVACGGSDNQPPPASTEVILFPCESIRIVADAGTYDIGCDTKCCTVISAELAASEETSQVHCVNPSDYGKSVCQ